MLILLHVLLLISAVALTGACLALYGGHPQRSLWKVLLFALPAWLLGVTSMLVLSANGVPAIEWGLPLICILILGIGCKSERGFTSATTGLTSLALLLCVNFFVLTSRGYTAVDRSQMTANFLKRSIKSEAEDLRKRHAPDEILPSKKVASTQRMTFHREWHTPVTRLYRIEKQPVAVWYPGGPIYEGADKLEIRNQ